MFIARAANREQPGTRCVSGTSFGRVMGVPSCCLPPWWCACQRLFPASEYLNNAHRPATIRARFPKCERNDLGGWPVILSGYSCAEQRADLGDIGLAARAGEQTIVADAMEAIWKHMDQEAADELVGGKAHDGSPITILDPVIFPAECDSPGIRAEQPAVGDRDTVG